MKTKGKGKGKAKAEPEPKAKAPGLLTSTAVYASSLTSIIYFHFVQTGFLPCPLPQGNLAYFLVGL